MLSDFFFFFFFQAEDGIRDHCVTGVQTYALPIVNYLSVLDADEEAEHAKDAGRHAEIEPDTIGVSGPRAGTGSDDHFMTGQILDYLVDEWEHRGSTAVDEALAGNLDDVCVRQELDDGLRVEQAHLSFVGRARAH